MTYIRATPTVTFMYRQEGFAQGKRNWDTTKTFLFLRAISNTLALNEIQKEHRLFGVVNNTSKKFLSLLEADGWETSVEFTNPVHGHNKLMIVTRTLSFNTNARLPARLLSLIPNLNPGRRPAALKTVGDILDMSKAADYMVKCGIISSQDVAYDYQRTFAPRLLATLLIRSADDIANSTNRVLHSFGTVGRYPPGNVLNGIPLYSGYRNELQTDSPVLDTTFGNMSDSVASKSRAAMYPLLRYGEVNTTRRFDPGVDDIIRGSRDRLLQARATHPELPTWLLRDSTCWTNCCGLPGMVSSFGSSPYGGASHSLNVLALGFILLSEAELSKHKGYNKKFFDFVKEVLAVNKMSITPEVKSGFTLRTMCLAPMFVEAWLHLACPGYDMPKWLGRDNKPHASAEQWPKTVLAFFKGSKIGDVNIGNTPALVL